MSDYNHLPPRIRAFFSRCLANKHFNGWCDEVKAAAMIENVLEHKPKTYVEIGVFAGRSLMGVGLAMSVNGLGGKAYGIDPWSAVASTQDWEPGDPNHEWWKNLNHEAIFTECREYVDLLQLGGIVELIRDTSAGALNHIKKVSPIELLHIDGNHSEEHALFDVSNYVPLVKRGGHVWFDDVDWDTTKTAQIKMTELCQHIGNVSSSSGTCALYRKL